MSFVYTNVFSNEELDYLTNHPEVLAAKSLLDNESSTMIYLSLPITDNKYRLMACVDECAEPWNSKGTYTIWHFALKNNSQTKNYGVYVNGGLLVESCSISFLEKNSNMNFK